MNISFVKLGEEKCEDCIMHKNHEDDSIEEEKACEICDSWKAHLERAKFSRKLYKEDAELDSTPSKAYFSIEMQKVIMLPRMPDIKTTVFSKGLVTFHKTFAPLGKLFKTKAILPTGVIWHEGILG